MRIALPFGLILIFAGTLIWLQKESPVPVVPELTSSLGGDFTLTNGKAKWSLDSQRGQVVLLNFGYTSCPDVCPTALMLMSQAMAQMDSGELRQVRGIFVSVDPERDGPQHTAEYASYFHVNITGVTGTIDEIRFATHLYGAFFQKQVVESYADYVVDHTAYTYLIDQQGQLVEVLAHGTSADQILAKIRRLLEN